MNFYVLFCDRVPLNHNKQTNNNHLSIPYIWIYISADDIPDNLVEALLTSQ